MLVPHNIVMDLNNVMRRFVEQYRGKYDGQRKSFPLYKFCYVFLISSDGDLMSPGVGSSYHIRTNVSVRRGIIWLRH